MYKALHCAMKNASVFLAANAKSGINTPGEMSIITYVMIMRRARIDQCVYTYVKIRHTKILLST